MVYPLELHLSKTVTVDLHYHIGDDYSGHYRVVVYNKERILKQGHDAIILEFKTTQKTLAIKLYEYVCIMVEDMKDNVNPAVALSDYIVTLLPKEVKPIDLF